MTPDEYIKNLPEKEVRYLALALLYKREHDGLNGRIWNASEHLKWEKRISNILKHTKKED
jgi:hypothetical protein